MRRAMKRLLPLVLLFPVALVPAGCANVSMMDLEAPALEGKSWVQSGGEATPVRTDGRYVLVEFFSPT